LTDDLKAQLKTALSEFKGSFKKRVMPSLIDIRRRIRSVKNMPADHQGHEDGLGG